MEKFLSQHKLPADWNSNCNRTQVRLPAATKANTEQAGADVKDSGLFSGASHLEDGGLMTPSPSPPLSGGRGVYKEGEGNRAEINGGGWKVPSVQTSTVHFGKASGGLVHVILI